MTRLLGSLIGIMACVFAWSNSSKISSVHATETTVSQLQATNVPSRALLDQYCVTCHNDRLKTAGLMLDQIDIGQVGAHAEVLEKVVKKLRSGQMPPEGRPRPDTATIDAFVTSLEALLDREGMETPNPGRVASRRLNRVE